MEEIGIRIARLVQIGLKREQDCLVGELRQLWAHQVTDSRRPKLRSHLFQEEVAVRPARRRRQSEESPPPQNPHAQRLPKEG